MIRRPRPLPLSTSALAVAMATGAIVVLASEAAAQSRRGTMSAPAPRVTTPPPRPSGGSIGQPTRPSASGRGYMTGRGGSPGLRSGGPRRGDLPRIVTEPRKRGYAYTYDRHYGRPAIAGHGGRTRYYRHGSSVGYGLGGCTFGCSGIRAGVRLGRFAGSFVIGYPLFVPVVVPYYHHVEYERYDDAETEVYASERPASKLIVVGGGSASGSDALTVESFGDSVRLSWLANGRQAREVKLFVADSAKRELATRSASPSSPTATFEVATLSAPVAFAGVTVVFADGVTSTTLVPYRGDTVFSRPR
jgi:hypothetical protein